MFSIRKRQPVKAGEYGFSLTQPIPYKFLDIKKLKPTVIKVYSAHKPAFLGKKEILYWNEFDFD